MGGGGLAKETQNKREKNLVPIQGFNRHEK